MEDDRFIRDGRTLREWLPDLIDPAPLTRRRAENAVSAMWWGAPIADATTYMHLPADPEAHRTAWGRHITDIINDPAFDGAAVPALIPRIASARARSTGASSASSANSARSRPRRCRPWKVCVRRWGSRSWSRSRASRQTRRPIRWSGRSGASSARGKDR